LPDGLGDRVNEQARPGCFEVIAFAMFLIEHLILQTCRLILDPYQRRNRALENR
jgi:hypothetical protein